MDPIAMKNFIEGLMRKNEDDTIEFNRNLMAVFLATIPVGNRIQNLPALATLRTMPELERVKTFIEMFYEGGAFMPAGTFDDWKILPAGPVEAVVQSNSDKAEIIVRAFVAENPSALSFAYLNSDVNAVGYAAKRQEHTSGLKENHPILRENKLLSRRKYIDLYKAARNSGYTGSVLDGMPPQVQTEVMTEISIKFKECKAWFQQPVSTIDEGDFLKYFLLLCNTLSEADMLEIIRMVKDIKMSDDSIDAYSKFDSEFWYMLQVLKSGGGKDPFAPRRTAELHAEGLRGPVQAVAKEKSKSVIDDLHAEYVIPVAEYMQQYRTSHPHIEMLTKKVAVLQAERAVRSAGRGGGRGEDRRPGDGRGGGGGGRGAGGRQPYVNAVTGNPPADPPDGATANAAFDDNIRLCLSCHEPDHKIFKCFKLCQLVNCPRKFDLSIPEHYARNCKLVKDPARFKILREACSSDCYIPRKVVNSSNSSISSDWRVKKPLIQYDAGSNINAAPCSPFNLPVRPPSASDSIDIANGDSIPVDAVCTLGTSDVLIVPSFPSMLLSQSFVEKSKCSTILADNQLHLIDSTTNQLEEILAKSPPIISVEASNGLYFFNSDHLELLATRQLSSTDTTQPTGKNVTFSNPLIIQPSNSVFIAKYHTIGFPTVKDLVLFWHKTLNHASETRMIAVVENKLIANLPAQLTVAAIRKYFPKSPNPCYDCPLGNLQRLSSPPAATHNYEVPIGAHWILDFGKFSGSDDKKKILAYGGNCTHVAFAIEYQTGRIFELGTKAPSEKIVLECIKKLKAFNTGKGYTWRSMTIDKQYVTKGVTAYLSDPEIHADIIQVVLSDRVNGEEILTSTSQTILFQNVAIPYEHFSTGSVERLIRTVRETNWKKTVSDPDYDDRLWLKNVHDTCDVQQMLPTVHHPTSSPYKMYDHFTVDAQKTPILPFKSIVIAHIPNERQNTTSGRGFEAMVVGRQSASTGGIQLFNLKTKKFVVRGTFKFLGEHPVKGLLFESPIHIEIADGDDVRLTSLAPVTPSTPPIIPYVAIDSGEPPAPVTTPVILPVTAPAPTSNPVTPPQSLPQSQSKTPLSTHTVLSQRQSTLTRSPYIMSWRSKKTSENRQNTFGIILIRLLLKRTRMAVSYACKKLSM
jgi:hypothetical protein